MLDDLIEPLVTTLAPQLLALTGIGIQNAGQLLVTAGDNPDRMHSEASFASSPASRRCQPHRA